MRLVQNESAKSLTVTGEAIQGIRSAYSGVYTLEKDFAKGAGPPFRFDEAKEDLQLVRRFDPDVTS